MLKNIKILPLQPSFSHIVDNWLDEYIKAYKPTNKQT